MAATKSAYAGMVQVAENANKKPVQRTVTNNGTAGGGGITKSVSSTLKLPKMFTSRMTNLHERHHQLEMHRYSMDPSRGVPISINSSSMPSVYAQINGSCGNLPHNSVNNTNQKSDFERRRSDDKCLIKDRNDISPVRRSIPSEVMGHEFQERLAPIVQRDIVGCGDTSEDSNASGEDEMKSMLAPYDTNNISSIKQTMNNTQIMGSTAECVALNNGSAGGDRATEQQHRTSSSDVPDRPSNRKQQRNIVARLLSRILGKAKRKRAAGTYEKRLSLEIKAAKTVAIVTGCFIFCWLGFSIYYGLTAFDVYVNEAIWSIFFWLGYLNSAFNPVIYTVFNREFRTCFKQLLTCNNMIFAGRGANQVPMCNSFNSQLRLGNDAMINSRRSQRAEQDGSESNKE